MVFGAVSLEELLGHCGEALNVYARHADAIESRLVSFGYEPPGNNANPHRLGFDSQTSAALGVDIGALVQRWNLRWMRKMVAPGRSWTLGMAASASRAQC